jgi:hypothetical protein
MPVPSPYQIVLSAREEAALAVRSRSVRGPYRDRLRAAIVLAAAADQDRDPQAHPAGGGGYLQADPADTDHRQV